MTAPGSTIPETTARARSACAVCANPHPRPFWVFHFGTWRMEEDAAHRDDFHYDLMACDVCGHVMVDLEGVAARYGADFVTRLYDLPQAVERWTVPGRPAEVPFAEMVDFVGAAGLPEDGAIVDFGCGGGHLLVALRDHHGVATHRLMGLDFRPPDFGISTLSRDLAGLEDAGPLPCDGFRMAYCVHTLEHLADPGALLRTLRRRAAPGAHLYLEVPDHEPLDPEADRLATLRTAQHLHYFRLDTLERLAASRGWTVVRRDTGRFGVTWCARLLLRADPADAVRVSTIEAEAGLDRSWRAAAGRILGVADRGAIALWGLGGDLCRMMEASPELAAAIVAGRFVLVDSALAGRRLVGGRFAGLAAVGPEALSVDGGPVVITSRTAKIRRAIREAGSGMGIADSRWFDPYAETAEAPSSG